MSEPDIYACYVPGVGVSAKRGDGETFDDGTTPAVFARHAGVQAAPAVYIAGGPRCAPLLVTELLEARQDNGGKGPPLFVCSPLAWRGIDPYDGKTMCNRLWHAVNRVDVAWQIFPIDLAADYTAYALAAEVLQNGVSAKARQLLLHHPAYPVLSFVQGDLSAGVELVSLLVDPRWFRHPTRPNRTSHMVEYLGLVPTVIADVLAERTFRLTASEGRCRTTVRAGLGDVNPSDPSSLSSLLFPRGPFDFLRRIYASKEMNDERLKAATRCFVRLLCEVWLAERTALRGAGRAAANEMFDPRRFFHNADEADAYVAHRATLFNGSELGSETQ